MDVLIDAKRRLNDEERRFRDIFVGLIANMVLMLQAGEQFHQCLYTEGDYVYYNPSWFVSNYGYIISVARNRFFELKPSLKTGGFERHGDTRWTEYLLRTYPNWQSDQEKGWEPQYYFYGNTYPSTHGLRDKKVDVVAQKIVAFYFLPEDKRLKVLDPEWEVHHKKSFDWSKPSKYNNRADNLQILWEDPNTTVKEHPEREQHTFAHNTDRATTPAKVEELKKMSQEPGVTHYVFMQPGGLEKFVLQGLRMNPDVAVGVSVKNEDGSTYMNAYYSGADAKPVEE